MAIESPAITNPGRNRVQSVARALEIIEIVANGPHDGNSLSELAKTIGTSKSTALALIRTLVSYGYLSNAKPGPRYCLGMKLVRLGDIASQQLPIGELSRPILAQIAEDTKMTSRVAINDHGYPVFVERFDGPGSVRFYTPLGQREVPYACAAGKAILASLTSDEIKRICADTGLEPRTSHTITDIDALLDNLSQTKRRGYAIDDEEDAEGILCIASPFFDHTESCIGAISVTGIKGDLPTWRVDEIGRTVKSYAGKITEILGGQKHSIDSDEEMEK